MTVLASDLGTYLGVTADDARASYLIGLATQLCQSVVNPLPAGADAVVLDVAARAYGNPANVIQQTVGPFSANYGPVAGGLWLTRANKATLRRLAGGGGAFTIDTTPANAGQGLAPWDEGNWGYVGDGFGDGSGWI
jgi:hypothetical protein